MWLLCTSQEPYYSDEDNDDDKDDTDKMMMVMMRMIVAMMLTRDKRPLTLTSNRSVVLLGNIQWKGVPSLWALMHDIKEDQHSHYLPGKP